MTTPRAFLSYSTADEEIAEKLAHELRANGVDVFFARWSIAPGDSLRQRIEEGIDSADFFLALLTPNSIKSQWVATELDAGLIRRIDDSCKLVPLVHELSPENVPTLLRTYKWVPLEVDELTEAVRELLAVCYGVSAVPPLGPRPEWATLSAPTESGLSERAWPIVVFLNENSATGLGIDSAVDVATLREKFDLTIEEIGEVIDELEESAMIGTVADGCSPLGIRGIYPRPNLFFASDSHLRGWDHVADSQAFAAAGLNLNPDGCTVADVARAIGWEPRRVNAATSYLIGNGYAEDPGFPSDGVYEHAGIWFNPKTRRFIRAKLGA